MNTTYDNLAALRGGVSFTHSRIFRGEIRLFRPNCFGIVKIFAKARRVAGGYKVTLF